MDLYSEIMNIQICDKEVEELFTQEAYAGYKLGRQAMRSDAAELAFKADDRIEELEKALKAILDWQPTQHVQSIFDDHELWNRAEELLK